MSQLVRWLIAKNIRTLRNNAKLKREELSLVLGFDNSYISKLERGKINITVDRLEKIAKYFNVEISKLFKDK